jgi:hypothetical protein
LGTGTGAIVSSVVAIFKGKCALPNVEKVSA